MRIGDLLTEWLRANRDFARELQVRRRVRRLPDLQVGTLYRKVHESYEPCFVLSTGRCGTKLLTELLDRHPEIEPHHEPKPTLSFFSPYAYRHSRDQHAQLKLAVDCARYDLIRDAYLLGKKYVETGNPITFFARQLAELYPNSRFIHLIRKPAAFVESGYSRGWYNDDVITDEYRIRPADPSVWSELSRPARIAWLWNETNDFVESFKRETTCPVITIRSEELFRDPAVARDIYEFVKVEPLPGSQIARLLRRPVNPLSTSQRKPLSDADRQQIQDLTPLATLYYGSSNETTSG